MKTSNLFSKWGTFKKGMDAESIQISFANHLQYSLSKDQYTATLRDLYHSLALASRDRMVERWIRTQQMYHDHDMKRVYYLSAELMRILLDTHGLTWEKAGDIIHVVYCWLKLKDSAGLEWYPRTFIFGGKAAPAYHTAKMIIRLICHVAEMINHDRSTNDRLKVVFLPNYRVSLAEKIFPAADVSEQISTAGFEASGTSNMKFALNGALTVGTLDGANIEIMEAVGKENIFIFGLNSEEVQALRPHYNPREYVHKDPYLEKSIDLIRSGLFNPEEPDLFTLARRSYAKTA